MHTLPFPASFFFSLPLLHTVQWQHLPIPPKIPSSSLNNSIIPANDLGEWVRWVRPECDRPYGVSAPVP